MGLLSLTGDSSWLGKSGVAVSRKGIEGLLFIGNNSQSKENDYASFDVATFLLLLLETYGRQSVCSTMAAEKETTVEWKVTKKLLPGNCFHTATEK